MTSSLPAMPCNPEGHCKDPLQHALWPMVWISGRGSRSKEAVVAVEGEDEDEE